MSRGQRLFQSVKIDRLFCDLHRIEESRSGNDTLSVGETVQGWLRDSFDNDATPFFALIICLWGERFIINHLFSLVVRMFYI